MKPLLLSVCILVILAGSSVGQDAPFARFTRAANEERGGFSGNKENLSKFFNEERIRLGSNFERELWKYLGDDADKHYWIASFLTRKSYLHGNEPVPELAFQIRSNGLRLIEKRSDKRSLGRKVTMSRQLAVSEKLAGKQEDAIRYRDNAMAIIAQHRDDLDAYIARQTEFDKCVYENIVGSIEKCNPNPPEKEKIISAGWMNSRALNFVIPAYPRTIKNRKAARVDVKILTDVNGLVISAEIIRGPAEFHEAAIEAAKKLRFPPMRLSDVPAKVSGWVSFDFRP